MDVVALVATVTKPQCAAKMQAISRPVTWLQIRSDLIVNATPWAKPQLNT